MKQISKICISVALLLLAGGCFTIRYDAKGGVTIDPHIETFSVQLFVNRASLVEPTFSQDFTDELKSYIENNTSLRLINGMGDVDFSGVITTYEISAQAISANDESAMTRFTIGIKFEYKDRKQPENNFEKTVSAYRDFDNTESFSSVQDELSEEIMDEIIELVFNAAFVNW